MLLSSITIKKIRNYFFYLEQVLEKQKEVVQKSAHTKLIMTLYTKILQKLFSKTIN